MGKYRSSEESGNTNSMSPHQQAQNPLQGVLGRNDVKCRLDYVWQESEII